MATIGERLAKEIIANDGYYADDPRVMRVVKYTNFAGGEAWAIEYAHELGKYAPSEFVREPEIVGEAD